MLAGRWFLFGVLLAGCEGSGSTPHQGSTPDAILGDALLLDGASPNATCAPMAWTISAVDIDQVSSGGTHALTADGGIHVVYPAYPSLRYARRAPGDTAWTIESIDAWGTSPALAVDAAGTVHVTYAMGDHQLEYAYRPQSGGWYHETVADAAVYGGSSLEVDSQGGVHVAYWTHPAYDVMYARRVGADDWLTEDIDTSDAGEGVSLVIDQALEPHVTYHSYDGSLRYAHRSANGWELETVDPTWGDPGRISDLFIDASGTLHALYSSAAWPRYATRPPGGPWQPFEHVTAMRAWYASGAVTNDGVYMLTYEPGHGFMWFGHRDPDGAWSSELINPEGTPRGRLPAVAVDAAGGIHVTFGPLNADDEHYAYRCL